MSDYLDFIPIPPAIKTGTTSVTTDVPGNQVTLAANGTTRLEIDSTESTFTGNVQLGSGTLTTTGTINAGNVQLGSGPLNTSGTVTTGALRAGAGAAATPSITFGADTNTGLYRVNENELGITTGGVQQLRINLNEAVFNQDVQIHGAGATIGGSNIDNAYLLVGNTSNGIGFDDNEMYSSGSDLVIGTIGGTNRVLFRPNATEVFVIDDTVVDSNVILNLSNNRITNVGTPTSGTDAATKSYVDSNTGATGMGDGSAASPGWAFTSDTNTGFFRPSAEVIGFSASGTERMRVNTNGLQISSGQSLYIQDGSISAPGIRFSDDTNTGMYSPSNDIVGFTTGGAERLRIASASTSVSSGYFNVATAGNVSDPAIQLGSTVGIYRAVNDLRNGINISIDNSEEVRIDNIGLRIAAGDTFGWINDSTKGMQDFGSHIAFKTANVNRLIIESTKLSVTAPISLSGGSASTPQIYFNNDVDTGIYGPSTGIVGITSNGVLTASFNSIDGLNMQGLPITNATFSAANFSSLTVADGSAAAPSIAFADDLDTGIFSQFTNRISLTAGGFERLQIDGNSGYVYSLAQMLSQYIGDDATKPNYSFAFDSNTGMFTPSADILGFSTGGVERARFSSAGLTVLSGDLTVSSGDLTVNSGVINLPTGTETVPSINFGDTDSGLWGEFDGRVGIALNGVDYCYFSDSSFVQGLHVENDNFRIGNDFRNYIEFDADQGSGVLESTRFRIVGNNNFNNLIPRTYLFFSEYRDQVRDYASIYAETLDSSPTTFDTKLNIRVYDYSSGTASSNEIVEIESGGVDINGTLEVSSSVLFPQAYISTTTSAVNVNIASGGLLRRSTSSIQFKDNVTSLDKNQASTMLHNLRVVTYTSKIEDDDKDPMLGLIAEEVADINPMLAFFDGEGEPNGVQYDRVALLAIVELQKVQGENQALIQKVQDLETRLIALESQ